MIKTNWVLAVVLTVTVTTGFATIPALAEALPRDDAQRACWSKHTRERTRVRLAEPTAVDFSNLRDGYSVRSPFLVDFSVRGMGVVPAGKAHPKAGHHHLLIDKRLPPSVTEKIPFDDHHRHFGKGQTGVELALPAGRHTLRLLFADHEHRPHFVFSPEIVVLVSGPRSVAPLSIDPANFEASCNAWYQEELTRPRPPGKRALITNLRDGEPVVSPFNLRFAVDGFGVAARGHGADGSGHFMLDVLVGDKLVQAIDLANGATQANLFVPVGNYTLRLRFMDDSRSQELLRAPDIKVSVVVQEKL